MIHFRLVWTFAESRECECKLERTHCIATKYIQIDFMIMVILFLSLGVCVCVFGDLCGGLMLLHEIQILTCAH